MLQDMDVGRLENEFCNLAADAADPAKHLPAGNDAAADARPERHADMTLQTKAYTMALTELTERMRKG